MYTENSRLVVAVLKSLDNKMCNATGDFLINLEARSRKTCSDKIPIDIPERK